MSKGKAVRRFEPKKKAAETIQVQSPKLDDGVAPPAPKPEPQNSAKKVINLADDGPAAAKPTTAKPAAAKPTTAKPTAAKPTTAKPTAAKPTTAKPTAAKPTTAKPAAAKPAAAKPTAAKSVAEPVNAVASEIELLKAKLKAVKNRRLRAAISAIKLFFFVIIPAALSTYYMAFWATPFYESKSVFTIQTAETSSAPGFDVLGAQFLGTGDTQDLATIREFLLSHNTMRRLNDDLAFLDDFRGEKVDVMRRLWDTADEGDELKYFLSKVDVAFDPTEKVAILHVRATTPERAREASEKLLSYGEEKVNDISARVRSDKLVNARKNLEERRAELGEARKAILKLQQVYGEPNPLAILEGIVGRKVGLEQKLAFKNAELKAILFKEGGTARKTVAIRTLEAEIQALQNEIESAKVEIAQSSDKLAQFEEALFAKETQQEIWVSALSAYEAAELEATRQQRYLAVINEPLTARDAKYPQLWRSAFLALLSFFFGYTILTMILAIIREHARI